MSSTARTFVAVIVAAIVVYLITLTMPLYTISPKGIVLPVGKGHQVIANSNKVALFDELSAPISFNSIGWVNVEYHTLQGGVDVEQRVQDFAQALAAKAGGNGIIVNLKGHTLSSTPKELSIQILRGQVIYQPASSL